MRAGWLLGAASAIALGSSGASAQTVDPLCPVEGGLVMGIFEVVPGTLQVNPGPIRHHQVFATVEVRHRRLLEVQEEIVSPDFGYRTLPAGALVYEAEPGVYCGYGTVGRKRTEPQGLCLVADPQGRSYLHSAAFSDDTPWIPPTVRFTAYRYSNAQSSAVAPAVLKPTSRVLEPPLRLRYLVHGLSRRKNDLALYIDIWDGRAGTSRKAPTRQWDPGGVTSVRTCGGTVRLRPAPDWRAVVAERVSEG